MARVESESGRTGRDEGGDSAKLGGRVAVSAMSGHVERGRSNRECARDVRADLEAPDPSPASASLSMVGSMAGARSRAPRVRARVRFGGDLSADQRALLGKDPRSRRASSGCRRGHRTEESAGRCAESWPRKARCSSGRCRRSKARRTRGVRLFQALVDDVGPAEIERARLRDRRSTSRDDERFVVDNVFKASRERVEDGAHGFLAGRPRCQRTEPVSRLEIESFRARHALCAAHAR